MTNEEIEALGAQVAADAYARGAKDYAEQPHMWPELRLSFIDACVRDARDLLARQESSEAGDELAREGSASK